MHLLWVTSVEVLNVTLHAGQTLIEESGDRLVYILGTTLSTFIAKSEAHTGE